MFSRARPDPDLEVTKCPVCQAVFGKRDKSGIYKAHCAECRATFYWKPWADKPSVTMDSAPKERKFCNREGCVCRD